MKPDPGGGLLAKLARFVRHPTVDWVDLDAAAKPAPQRDALAALIGARRRNDEIRNRELDELRALMRSRSPAALAVRLPPDAEPAATRHDTIAKIARIESQMSRHWLRQGEAGGTDDAQRLHIPAAAVPSRHDGGITVPAHLQALACDLQAAPGLPAAPAAPSRALPDSAELAELDEAALRWANGDEAAAERALRAALSRIGDAAVARLAWQTLLDFHVATGDVAGFDRSAAEHAARHGLPVPQWPTMPAPPGAPQPLWSCPPLLDAAAVQALADALEAAGESKSLAWSALVAADPDAAQALLALVERWSEREVEFRFDGAATLRRRLKASTPSGRRENDPLWWRLRLALLRLMRRADEFELVALDCCVTYGELPPDWQPPRCRYREANEPAGAPTGPAAVPEPIRPLATQLGGIDVLEWPAMPMARPAPSAGAQSSPQLRGALCGDIAAELAALQAALDAHPAGPAFAIDCRALQRVDFCAAGRLLQWLPGAAPHRPELVGVNRLVALFLHLAGIDDMVALRLREY